MQNECIERMESCAAGNSLNAENQFKAADKRAEEENKKNGLKRTIGGWIWQTKAKYSFFLKVI